MAVAFPFLVLVATLFAPTSAGAASEPREASVTSATETSGAEAVSRTRLSVAQRFKIGLKERQPFLSRFAVVVLAAPGLLALGRAFLLGLGRRRRLAVTAVSAMATAFVVFRVVSFFDDRITAAAQPLAGGDLPFAPSVAQALLLLPVTLCATFLWTRERRWDALWHAAIWTAGFVVAQTFVTIVVPFAIESDDVCCAGGASDRTAGIAIVLAVFAAALAAGVVRRSGRETYRVRRVRRLSLSPPEFLRLWMACVGCLVVGYSLVALGL